MRFVAAIETWCANVVERTFARAFPGALEPAQIARRLIATIEHAPPSLDDEGATGYIVRLSANDAAALETERELLERQWTRMAQALCARIVSAAPAPTVQIRADPRLPNGSIVIDTVVADVTAGQPLCLRVERGVANASAYPLRSRDTVLHSLIIGRDPRCDVVVTDSRASRRHARVDVTGETVAFEDLDSTNGTLYNGEPTRRGHLLLGDRLQIGDTIFRIAAET